MEGMRLEREDNDNTKLHDAIYNHPLAPNNPREQTP